MLVDIRADSAAWQAEKKKRKSDNAAAATEDAYPGKQPDMSYQKYRSQLSWPSDSLDGRACLSGQSTIAREVVPSQDSLPGPGFGTDLARECISQADESFKPRNVPAVGSHGTRN